MAQIVEARKQAPPDAAQAERIRASSPVLQGRYPTSQAEKIEAEKLIAQLSQPATVEDVACCVSTLLLHYFVNDIPENFMERIADSWQKELAGEPLWAIERACHWWISKHNAKRAKKPLPGDISERVGQEVRALTHLATMMVNAYEKYGDTPPSFLK